jgi:hypothetical protein
MSSDHDIPPGEDYIPEQPTARGPRRGYFFYIAAFFILVGLLCYLLSNSNVISLETGSVTPPTPAPAPK